MSQGLLSETYMEAHVSTSCIKVVLLAKVLCSNLLGHDTGCAF